MIPLWVIRPTTFPVDSSRIGTRWTLGFAIIVTTFRSESVSETGWNLFLLLRSEIICELGFWTKHTFYVCSFCCSCLISLSMFDNISKFGIVLDFLFVMNEDDIRNQVSNIQKSSVHLVDNIINRSRQNIILQQNLASQRCECQKMNKPGTLHRLQLYFR